MRRTNSLQANESNELGASFKLQDKGITHLPLGSCQV